MLDRNIELADNAMLKARPELFYEWNFEKNKEIGLDIYKATKGSGKLAWWNCLKCDSVYDMKINSRSGRRKANCPYCRGYRVNHTNSLASLNPSLASEWHPVKNEELTPHDVTCGSNKIVWWLGKCGHEWKSSIDNRGERKGNGCGYCAGQEILIGFNDMWTTNPELARQLANPKDGYRHMKGSNKKVDWKCCNCDNIIRQRFITTIVNQVYCPKCSDGVSYPEKFMYNFLKVHGIHQEPEKTFNWSQSKRYDFYLPDYNWIIEVHGKQHYEQSFNSKYSFRTLEAEQENDKLKERLAKENGIDKYIVIDARKSERYSLSTFIKKSPLKNIVDMTDVDWKLIHSTSIKSLIQEACEMWRDGNEDIDRLSQELGVSIYTVKRYLREGNRMGLCKYPKITRLERAIDSRRREVVQLTLEGKFLREWKIIADVERVLGIHQSSVGQCCLGRNKTAGGYRWMYKEDYDKIKKKECD